MPLFLSEEEFLRCSHDVSLVAEKADSFVQNLYLQLETVKAESDAATITAEQTCSLIEQKYVSLSTEFSSLQTQYSELNGLLGERAMELEKLFSEKQQLLLQSIEKGGEIERMTREVSEVHKSKRQLMDMLEQRDIEINEKNAMLKEYLEKIVNFTESIGAKEARLRDVEPELARMNATSARYLQEKELVERHNIWLNEELTAKVDNHIQLRKAYGELEADMSSKLADVERKYKESSDSLTYHKDRVRELEAKLASLEEDLLSTKGAAASTEDRFSAEIATVTKLVELYKESSEEWSKKAGELEGVIKALETHLNQVEKEYKDKLESEESSRNEVEKECADLKEKLEACRTELENLKKENELNDLPLSSFVTNSWGNRVDAGEMIENDQAIVPRIPAGVSGTALAASLLRDGWSLAKMYIKYQEAVDALRHEQLGRKQTQAILERVLYEIEGKAAVIMEEREEHEKLVEAYSDLSRKLQHSLSEHSSLETTIQGLKASLKKQERDYSVAEKEIVDLQKQIAVLLKECRDVQLRCGSSVGCNDFKTGPTASFDTESDSYDHLLTFKDINGLVERNVQLQSLVRNLTHQIEEEEAKLKEKYETEMQQLNEENVSKINAVLMRSEEQVNMIESLHNSVSMYKKLYEEEHKRQSSYPHPREAVPEQGSRQIVVFHESNHATTAMMQEYSSEHVKGLEEELVKSRSELTTLQADRDKLALEAKFAQEKLARFMKDFDHQREEHNGVLSRNIEFSQLIVDYQRKIREFSESASASEERSRKLTMEVSVLKQEKEILQNSEKRASDEVCSLSERLYRVQASLDTIQGTEVAREEARGIERRRLEEYTKKIEREWAEVKKELQEERDNVRKLTVGNETTMTNSFRQVEELSKELSNALRAVAAAESRAAVAEAHCSDLEKIIASERTKDSDGVEGSLSSSSNEKALANYRDEIEKLRGESQANKDHMLQYKSIAQVNEAALKQMESSLESFKTGADQVRSALEAESRSLREKINELENECKLKSDEANSANAGKEEALAGVSSEIASLKDDCSVKMSQISVLESQVSALMLNLEEEHQRWQTAQRNYERQVILQSETIQELTKTSRALAAAQEETSKLRGDVNILQAENCELKSKLETEKSIVEVYKNEVDKKYNEVNELNKILHSRLDTMHIKLADKELGKASGTSSQAFADDDGIQSVVNYLRRSKEITETEISLLKQEKLRLQSQLERALKSAESAQALLHSEREKSRALLFTEDEFKSLQLQLRELNLLRESNVQLREENRHNFDECQKLREAFQKARTETENFEKHVREKESEVENRRKEIEQIKAEKDLCEKRIIELEEKCKNVDVEDYTRLKDSFQQLQVNLREKDSQIEEARKRLLEKEEVVSALERDLSRCRAELSERESRVSEIMQAEATQKSEAEKYKRLNLQLRRKSDNLSKEKEEFSKQVQSLNKQLEEAKQVVKRSSVDSANEQTVKEKDTRVQMLEKMVERLREDLKKEKEEHKEKEDHNKELDKKEKVKRGTLVAYYQKVNSKKEELVSDLIKHKQALKLLQDEVEKLKNSGSGQADTSSVVQYVATPILEDFASAYFQALENFEQVGNLTPGDLDSADTPSQDSTPSTDIGSQVPTSSAPSQVTNVAPRKTSGEREKRVPVTRANVRTGRKLVRPDITKPKEPQEDVDMSEADESKVDEPNTLSDVRKRSSDDILVPDEPTAGFPVPLLKKPKSSETPQEDEPSKVAEELLDEAVNVEHARRVELNGAEKDEPETQLEQVNEQAEIQNQAGIPSETVEIVGVKSDKVNEALVSDKQLGDDMEQDEEREEGELDSENNDGDGNATGQDVEENQAEELVEPHRSPSIEPLLSEALDVGEIDPSENQEEEKNDAEVIGNIDGSDKPKDDAGTIAGTGTAGTGTTVGLSNVADAEALGSTSTDVGGSEQFDSGLTPPSPASEQGDTGGKPPSPANPTIINISQRSRERGQERQALASRSSPGGRGRGASVTPAAARGGSATTVAPRGGRGILRTRIRGGGRSSRGGGQSPGT